MVWLQLIICVLIIVLLGRRVAFYGDVIAVKTKLGGLWIGLVLLSITTSLPELFNGVSAILIVDQPDLTVGNLLGANTFNLLNLAILDMYSRHHSIMHRAGPGHKLTGWFALILAVLITLSLWLQPRWNFTLGWIGFTIPVIFILYLLFIRKIASISNNRLSAEEIADKYETASLKRTLLLFSLSALCIIGAGIWLATLGDQIAAATGLGESFIGSILIGLITTLPEITVSYAALRLGAVDMAISNMIGSNMFNMFLICIDDLMYTKGAILANVSPNIMVTAVTVIVLTLITRLAFYLKPRRFHRVSWYNLLIVLVFIGSAYFSYRLNN